MAFLKRLGWASKENGDRGQYASVEDREHLVSKEETDLSLQQHHQELLESHRRLKLWVRGLCIALGLAVIALVVAMLNARATRTGSKILTPVPDSNATPSISNTTTPC